MVILQFTKEVADNKIRKKGDAKPAKDELYRKQVTSQDGILSQNFRLPTEVEWEFAAKANY